MTVAQPRLQNAEINRLLRRNKRTPSNASAIIRTADASFTLPCVVRNLSESGAKLSFGDSTPLPSEFILYLKSGSPIGWKCRTIWRIENNIGVRFLSIFDSDKVVPKRSDGISRPWARLRNLVKRSSPSSIKT